MGGNTGGIHVEKPAFDIKLFNLWLSVTFGITRLKEPEKSSTFNRAATKVKDQFGKQGIPPDAFNDGLLRACCWRTSGMAPFIWEYGLKKVIEMVLAGQVKSFNDLDEAGKLNMSRLFEDLYFYSR